jgi:hypothetical protein
MKARINQLLLTLAVVLLAANLLRSNQFTPALHADEPTKAAAVIRAEAFELVDKQGKVVAQLHVGEDGGGNIRLRSGDGMVRVKLGATKDGSGLILFDNAAEPAVALASGKTGTTATLAEKGKDKRVIKP